MGDVDYQSLLLSYQRKVAELINQNIVYEAKLNTFSPVCGLISAAILFLMVLWLWRPPTL